MVSSAPLPPARPRKIARSISCVEPLEDRIAPAVTTVYNSSTGSLTVTIGAAYDTVTLSAPDPTPGHLQVSGDGFTTQTYSNLQQVILVYATSDQAAYVSNPFGIFNFAHGFSLQAATGIAYVSLNDTTGGNTFDFTNYFGQVGIYNTGAFTDTVTATKNSGFTLTDSVINASDGMGLYLFDTPGVTVANFIDSGGGHSNSVSGWTGTGSLTNQGASSDSLTAKKDYNFTLTDTSISATDHLSMSLSGFGSATLIGGASNNRFDISGWTGSGDIRGQGGTDTIVAANAANFTLTDTGLSRTGAQKMTMSNINTATLTDTTGGHTFDISGWTGGGTLAAQTGGSTVAATNNANFTLANGSLLRTFQGTGAASPSTMSFSKITAANLTDTGGGNTFNVDGWTGGGTLTNSGLSTDILTATKAAGFTLSNSLLKDSVDTLNLSLAQTGGGIAVANLTDTAGGNTFDVGGWSYAVTLTNSKSGGSPDIVTATKAGGFTLTNTSITDTADLLSVTLAQTGSGIHTANLTDFAGGSTFVVSQWTFGGALKNTGATADAVAVAKAGGFTLSINSLTDTADTLSLVLTQTGGGIHTANLTDSTGGHTFNLGAGANGWSYTANLVNSGAVADVISVTRNGGFTLSATGLTDTADGLNAKFSAGSIQTANLTDATGGHTFIADAWPYSGTLTNSGSTTDAVSVTKAGGFTLTNTLLTDTADGMSLSLVQSAGGIHTANLTDSSGGHTFNFGGASGGWGYSVSLTVNGAADTISVARAGGFTLKNTSLTNTADGLSVSFASGAIGTANLTDAAGGHTFDVSAWTGSGLLTGFSSNVIVATKNAGFTLADASLAASDGLSMTLSGPGAAQLAATGSGHVFSVSGWTGGGSLSGVAGAADSVQSIVDADQTLSQAGLARSGLTTLTLSGIDAATLATPTGGHTLDLSGWLGSASVAALSGADALIDHEAASFTLADGSLLRSFSGAGAPAATTITLAHIGSVQLTDTAGGNGFDVSGWTGSAALANSGGASDFITASKTGGFALAAASLTDSVDSMSIALSQAGGGIHQANLTDRAGGQTFTVGQWPYSAALANTGNNADAISATKAGGFTLSDGGLATDADQMNLSIAQTGGGFHSVNLTDTAGGHVFDVSGWTHAVTLTDAASNPDSVRATKAGGFSLSDTTLSDTADGLSVTYASGAIQSALLTDTVGGHTFAVDHWSHGGTLSNTGPATDTISAAKPGGFTLADNSVSDSADAMNLTLSQSGQGIGIALLTDSAGGQTFVVDQWTHAATLANTGSGSDALSVRKAGGFTLTDASLTDSADALQLTLIQTGGGIRLATLTDTIGGQSIELSGWTHAAALAVSSATADTLIVAKAGGFTLTNTSLSDTADGMTVDFAAGAIQTANLTDTGGGHTFIVDHWSYGGALKNLGANSDTVAATKAGGFTLAAASVQNGPADLVQLTDSADAMQLTLSGIQLANLTDTSGGHSFDLSGWSHAAALVNSGSSPDTLVVAKAGGFILSNTSLSDTADSLTVAFAPDAIQTANLTDTTGGHTFIVDGWTHAGLLTNTGGTTDAVSASKAGGFMLVDNLLTDSTDAMHLNISSTGAGIHTAVLTDTAGGGSFDVSGWSHAGTFANATSVSDTLVAAKTGGFALSNTSLSADDGLNITYAAGAFRQAQLVDTAGGHTFAVSGWTYSGSMVSLGAAGSVDYTDAITGSDTPVTISTTGKHGKVTRVTYNIGAVLTNHLLYSTNGMSLTLTNMGAASLTAGSGANETLDASHFTGDLTLTGSASATGQNHDALIAGSGINHLVGGMQSDRFVLNGFSVSDTLTPSLEAAAGVAGERDLIDYSSRLFPAGHSKFNKPGAVVNLGLIGVAQAVNAKSNNPAIKALGLLTLEGQFDDLEGSRYADKLTGNKLSNVIFGDGGADVLAGGGVPPHLPHQPANHDKLRPGGASFFPILLPIVIPESIFTAVAGGAASDPFVIKMP